MQTYINDGLGHLPLCEQGGIHPLTGETWRDMPGTDNELKKLNFFFHRRGMLQRIGDFGSMKRSGGVAGADKIKKEG